jgi:hypothetical protein
MFQLCCCGLRQHVGGYQHSCSSKVLVTMYQKTWCHKQGHNFSFLVYCEETDYRVITFFHLRLWYGTSTVTVNMSAQLIKRHTMKTYRGVNVFLMSAVDRSEWLASCSGRFTPKERVPSTHRIGSR